MPNPVEVFEEKVEDLFGLIEDQGEEGARWFDEPCSQLHHALQTAHLASQNTDDQALILAALLHDIGLFLPSATAEQMQVVTTSTRRKSDGEEMRSRSPSPDAHGRKKPRRVVGRMAHEKLGEEYLRILGFSEKVCQLVGAHVVAKRYLCAKDPSYINNLTPSSRRSLEFQGGPLSEEAAAEFERDSWFNEKVALRKWDDQAMVPGAKVPPLETYHKYAVDDLTSVYDNVLKDYGLWFI